jgi:hypothetical protein
VVIAKGQHVVRKVVSVECAARKVMSLVPANSARRVAPKHVAVVVMIGKDQRVAHKVVNTECAARGAVSPDLANSVLKADPRCAAVRAGSVRVVSAPMDLVPGRAARDRPAMTTIRRRRTARKRAW